MKTKLTLFQASVRANDLATILAPACERLLIAGSIRREKAEIGDIEIVLIPKLTPITDMFGEPTGNHASALDVALADNDITPVKNGERYKQIQWQDMQADLFICTPETWGCVATIRTGSADFTQWLVTKKRQGGACPEHLSFKDGRLWTERTNGSGLVALDTSEEQQVFDTLRLDWIEPQQRIEGRWRR